MSKKILKHHAKGKYVLWMASADGPATFKAWLESGETYEKSAYEEDFMGQILRELDMSKSLEYNAFCKANSPTVPEKLAWLKTNAGFKMNKAGIKVKPQNPFMVTAIKF